MNEHRFELLITSVWSFLNNYYCRQAHLDPLDFVVVSQSREARLLVDDSSDGDAAFVAIEFPDELRKSILATENIRAHDFSVVSEEVSHFFHFLLCAEKNSNISILEMETRAEIDRFICFLHWNDFYPQLAMKDRPENCLQLCDLLFENRHFTSVNEQLYRDAESHAFHLLRRAFSHCWNRRWLDTTRFDSLARGYLLERMNARSEFDKTG
ncbi:MAG: hypothetical protein RLZZ488_2159 [Pseudomonadota bacterium]|jgi:hypothetical protein